MRADSPNVIAIKLARENRFAMNEKEFLDTAKDLFIYALNEKAAAVELLKSSDRFVQNLEIAGVSQEQFLKFARIYREDKDLIERLIRLARLPDDTAQRMRAMGPARNETVLNLSVLLDALKDWQKEVIHTLQNQQTGGNYHRVFRIKNETISSELLKRIQQECRNFGMDFDKVLSEPLLQAEIRDYLTPENEEIFLNLMKTQAQPQAESVVEAAERIRAKIDVFIETALTICQQTRVDYIKILKGLIEGELLRGGLSYDAVLNNAQAKGIFESDDQLKMTLLLHQGKLPGPAPKEQERPAREFGKEARQAARNHAARGQGFFTQFGIDRELVQEPQELKKVLRNLIRSLHPDKGGDTELCAQAIAMKQLIDNEQVEAYLELLDRYRANEAASPTPRT